MSRRRARGSESSRMASTPKDEIFNRMARATTEKAASVVPIIGKRYFNSLAFRDQIDEGFALDLVKSYGAAIKHPDFAGQGKGQEQPGVAKSEQPWPKHTISELTQYQSIRLESEVTTKERFLDHLLNQLLDLVDEGKIGISAEKSAELNFHLNSITNFSQLSAFLDWPRLDDDHPLVLLAKLNFAFYITTSYHDFLERALRQVGKEPEIEVCNWYEDLGKDSVFKRDESYSPSPKRPLVFHLHGVESIPTSLVLTEDDHLNFLTKIEVPDVLPSRVTQAIAQSSLVVMGFQVHDWDFKILFNNIIKKYRHPLNMESVVIQLEERTVDNEYLTLYSKILQKFEVWDSDPASFIRKMAGRNEGL